MNLWSLLALALGLSLDAFAVALSIGISLRSPVRTLGAALKTGLAFGGFQALMPLVGYLAGLSVARLEWVKAWDHWIAFGLLAGLGVKMVYEARFLPDRALAEDPTIGLTLLGLALATSLDALAGGFSLAMLRVPIAGPALAIGLTAMALSMLGVWLGRRAGDRFGARFESLGGFVLMAIGTKILIEHLLGG